ncbi:universal stress protein UspA [Arthrobacter sp. MYb227]|uniref:universal stress protein n=1 Tax=Arthrobacter sp. MYb227 TaxID=1848601 RepID=UPI000CFDDDC5|nr:universal stress protein [Arthrobacter sp. MYb227]PQZ89585.1 universal stress protein UspA [Arthrobacter sp. MYb227]
MKYIVGCTEDQRGREAISLAIALARSLAFPIYAEIELVHIIRGVPPEDAMSESERVYQDFQRQTARKWMSKALALIPQGLKAETHIRFADSMAEGLLGALTEFKADMVIVGAASTGPFRRFTVGSVANALLHASPMPVALAPSGYQGPRAITRITCAVGTRTGADSVVEVAVDSAAIRHVPLRLISLVALDRDPHRSDDENWARRHAQQTLDRAVVGVANRTLVTADVAQGKTIEAAIEVLDWDESEVVMIGSSRLASRPQIFLGTTANKMLRALPVPMVVIPRFHVPVPAAASLAHI